MCPHGPASIAGRLQFTMVGYPPRMTHTRSVQDRRKTSWLGQLTLYKIANTFSTLPPYHLCIFVFVRELGPNWKLKTQFKPASTTLWVPKGFLPSVRLLANFVNQSVSNRPSGNIFTAWSVDHRWDSVRTLTFKHSIQIAELRRSAA